MIDRNYVQVMATYNQWFNARLFAACATLSEQELREDRGAFFQSIHGTLLHLLECDREFLTSFLGEAAVPEPGTPDTFAELRDARFRIDQQLCDWSYAPQDAWLSAPITFESRMDGLPRTVPRWAFVVHMFNHQTHHRGQVTTLLNQAGIDVGLTDLHGSF